MQEKTALFIAIFKFILINAFMPNTFFSNIYLKIRVLKSQLNG